MLLSESRPLESGGIIRVYRLVGIVILMLSIVASFLALWTGGLVAALHELLRAIGLTSGSSPATPYPLGSWVLVIYALGAVLGCFVHRWPIWAAGALVPLGMVACVYGGPISRAYGAFTLAAGILLIGMVLYRRRTAGRAVE